jgi:hypothetical protein
MGTTTDHLRHSIARQRDRLCQEVPPEREAALRAVLHAQDLLPSSPANEPMPDIITGHRIANPGGNMAIALILGAPGTGASIAAGSPGGAIDDWAENFLRQCGELAAAGSVLANTETGFMRLVDDGDGLYSAWIATKHVPATWRERADIDWWAASIRKAHEAELVTLRDRLPDGSRGIDAYLDIARVYLKTMAYQLGYSSGVELGGLRVETWLDVLAGLIAWALRTRDRNEMPTPVPAGTLVAELAKGLLIPPDVVREAIAAFTVDRHNAAWHAAVPGVAAAPLVRLDGDRLLPSRYGLTTEPLLFLTRELRRRDPQGYHNAAQYREAAFREDLYAIFDDKRFVRSTGTIRLRHGKGDLRTDIDAVVFDRKTGALGVFELKSQDPFARSTAALTRQRDNVLYANRQVSGVLDWIRRFGANNLLSRVDGPTAKRFRANKVYPFVLGRYLVHFHHGARPDPRVAWGTWPQIVRLLDGRPLRSTDGSPIGSLFLRLQKDEPLIRVPVDEPPREIAFGDIRLVVHASYASYQSRNSR